MPWATSESGRARDAAALTAAAWLALSPVWAAPTETPEETLRRSDISTLAPESFHARLRVTGDDGKALDLEVWRAGESRILVRFLDPKDRGKYLLRLDEDLFFLAPKAKKPVKLSPSHKLGGGASLDQMLGTRYSREYAIERVTEAEDDARLVVLELRARTEKAPYPRVRYAVRRDLHRPVRADFLTPSGKLTSSVSFLEWEEGGRPRPRRLRVLDALRPKASVDVEIQEVQERPVPPGLFDLTDATERRKLETKEP